jgi:hypothetical protein
MTDVTVYRHGERWAVAEQGLESPRQEFPTREAAEMAARQLAGGGNVEVREDDPTGLEETTGGVAPERVGEEDHAGVQPSELPEDSRAEQGGL